MVEEYNLGVITFFSLAAGFLTGKYRTEKDLDKGARGPSVKARYFNERGHKIIAGLDTVSDKLHIPQATVALAWLLAKPTITAPIASATSLAQLKDILRTPEVELDAESLRLLNTASSY